MIFTAVIKSQYKISIFSAASRDLHFLIKEALYFERVNRLKKPWFSERNSFIRSQTILVSSTMVQHPFNNIKPETTARILVTVKIQR